MLVRFICILTRWILSTRYDVRVIHDFKNAPPKKGVLILPNHPAYTDPMIVFTWLYRWLTPRPLVHENYYRNPLFYPFMRLMNALEVKDVQKSGVNARLAIKTTIQTMADALNSGQNVILWPSGTLQKQAHEHLGANSAVYQILRAAPGVNICLVRSKGLWGSRFSQAFLGIQPELVKQMIISMGWMALNLLFFMPKRKVEVEIVQFTGSEFSQLGKLELNKRVEKWMNLGVDPTPQYRPYHFLGFGSKRRFPDFSHGQPKDAGEKSPEVFPAIKKMLSEYMGWEGQERVILPADRLVDLGMDSLQKMEFLVLLEKSYFQKALVTPETVGDLCAIAMGTKGCPVDQGA